MKTFDSGKRFGDAPRAEMHQATCNECGKDCEVPFKPNGRKPVLCHSCFRRDDDQEPKRFERSTKPAWEKPSWDKPAHPAFRKSSESSNDLHEQILEKLDAILRALTSAPRTERSWTPRPPMRGKRPFGKPTSGYKKNPKF